MVFNPSWNKPALQGEAAIVISLGYRWFKVEEWKGDTELGDDIL